MSLWSTRRGELVFPKFMKYCRNFDEVIYALNELGHHGPLSLPLTLTFTMVHQV